MNKNKPIAFPQNARSAMLDLVDQSRWSAVAEAIDAGYPLTVRNTKGQDLFAYFIESAAPFVDGLSLSWHSEIVRSMLGRGLSDSSASMSGLRPVSLALQSLRWDIVGLLLRHGHRLQVPGERPAWDLILDGLANGSRSAFPQKDVLWRFERTATLLLDEGLDPQPVFNVVLSLGFDRLAVRMMDLGVQPEVSPNPSFESAIRGSSPSVFFRILRDNEDQRRLVEQGSVEDVARWFYAVSIRQEPDVLRLLRSYLLPSMEDVSRPDQASAFIQSNWLEPLEKLVGEGFDLDSKIFDGRHLAHVAARYASEQVLLFLRGEGMSFDVGPDPWTGVDPAETIARRFPDFQVRPARVIEFRRRTPS